MKKSIPLILGMTLIAAQNFGASQISCAKLSSSPGFQPVPDQLSGNYYVGGTGGVPCSTCDFVNLTSAFEALNTQTITGPVNIILTSSYSSAEEDTFPLVLNNVNGASLTNTITIHPDAGVSSVITGAPASGPLLDINGASFVTINGSNNGTNSRDLAIINTSANQPAAVCFSSIGTTPLTNCTIKNTVVQHGSYGSYGISLNEGYYNDISIVNNIIQKCDVGIIAIGGSTIPNSYNLSITNNNLASTGLNAITQQGIHIEGFDGIDISGNDIGNINSTIGNPVGIILARGCKNGTVAHNKIHDISYNGTNGFGVTGVSIDTYLPSANIRFFNNLIYGLTADGNNYITNPLENPIGLLIFGAQSGIEVYYNSINLYGNTLNQPNSLSQAIFLDFDSEADIRNNMIVNTLGLSGTTGQGATGIYGWDPGGTSYVLDYNDYFINASGSGSNNAGYIATTAYPTLSDWQIATGKEIHGQSLDPQFVSNTDLNFLNTGLLEKGVAIAGITTDYDGNPRGNPPDIGAYEENIKTWNGNVSTQWNDAANWTPSGVPSQYNTIIIPTSTPFTCITNITGLNCKNAVIKSGATLNIPAFTELTVFGNLTIQPGGTLNNEGNVIIKGSLVNKNP
jgi:trimeric autotransporter adhesin